MDQITIQSEGRYPITNLFPGARRRFSDRNPYFLQNLLNIIREVTDIPVHILGYESPSFHNFLLRHIFRLFCAGLTSFSSTMCTAQVCAHSRNPPSIMPAVLPASRFVLRRSPTRSRCAG